MVVSRGSYIVFFGLISFFVFFNGGRALLRLFYMEVILVVPILLYPIFLDIFSAEIVYSDRFVYWFLQSFLFCVLFVALYLRSGFDLLRDVVFVTAVAALISLLSFTVQPFESFITSIQNDPIFEVYSNFEHRYRAHGFSQHLNFSYGVLMGFVAGMCLFLGAERKYYYALIPLMLFAAFVNARTGVIVFMVFLLVFILLGVKTKRSLVLCGFLGVATPVFFVLFPPQSMGIFDNWYFSIFADLIFAINGEDAGAVSTLFGSFIVFPEDILSFLFGTGESIYLRDVGNSDVGFILQIYYAGILFSIYLCLFMLFLYLRVGKKVGYLNWFPVMFILTFLIMNIKGFFFAGVPGVRLLFLLYVFFVVKRTLGSKKVWSGHV